MDILLMPARQPPVLEKVMKGLKKPLDILQTLLQSQLEEQINETHRVGPDTLRLAPLYTWRGIKKGNYALDQLRTKDGEYDDESDFDDDTEMKIREFLPGKLPKGGQGQRPRWSENARGKEQTETNG